MTSKLYFLLQNAQPEETDSGRQSRYLREYKATQSPGERTSGTRRKGLHHQRLVHEEKTSIANSKQEAQEMTEQIRAEFAEINTLSQQIVTGDDKDDEAIIARADAVRAEAIHAIEEFLN